MNQSPRDNSIRFIRSGFYLSPVERLDKEELKALKDCLTWSNPKSYFNKEKGTSKICLMNEGGSFYFGLYPTVKRNLPYAIKKDGVGTRGKVFDIGSNLRPYQAEALKQWYRKKQGIIKIVTRGGKTFILADAIRNIYEQIDKSQKICILVDSSDLLRQTIETIEQETGLQVEGFGGGIRKTKEQRQLLFQADIQVMMIQSIQSLFFRPKKTKKVRGRIQFKRREVYNAEIKAWRENRKKFLKYMKSVAFLAVDEVHEFGSEMRTEIITSFENIEWGMYLSATPYRDSDPIAAKRIKGYTGGIVAVVDEQQLVDQGYLAERIALLIEYDNPENEEHLDDLVEPYEKWETRINEDGEEEEFFAGYELEGYKEIESEYLEDNDERNLILKCILQVLIEMDLKTLAMSGIVNHVELLGKMVGKPYISGKDGFSSRDKRKLELLKGELNMLICSEIWKKGITLPEVQVFVNCDGGKEASLFRQKKGRVLGNAEDGVQDKAMIIDIMDYYQPFFGNHAINRLEVLVEDMGDENLVFVKWRGRKKRKKFKAELRKQMEKWFGSREH